MRAETSASISSWTSQRTDSRRKSPPGSSPLRRSSNNAILSSATVRLLSGCWSDNLHGKPTVASSSRPAFYTTPRDSIWDVALRKFTGKILSLRKDVVLLYRFIRASATVVSLTFVACSAYSGKLAGERGFGCGDSITKRVGGVRRHARE